MFPAEEAVTTVVITLFLGLITFSLYLCSRRDATKHEAEVFGDTRSHDDRTPAAKKACSTCGRCEDCCGPFYYVARYFCEGCPLHNKDAELYDLVTDVTSQITLVKDEIESKRGLLDCAPPWDFSERQEVESSMQAAEISADRLRFCQDSISAEFRDGWDVFSPRQGCGVPKVLACFHEDSSGIRLFALNNRTLFNAIYNGVRTVLVTVVEKPCDWDRRFTGHRPWTCMRVRIKCQTQSRNEPFVKIPAEAFPSTRAASRCWLVLEVRNLIKPQKENLYDLLNEICPELNIRRYEGLQREYARVRVTEDDAPLVRSAIKALAKQLDKKPKDVACVEVVDERRFDSPRD